MSLAPPQAYRKTEYTHRIGLAADKPAATDVLSGTLYFATDVNTFERSNGTIWETYAPSILPPVTNTIITSTDIGVKHDWNPGLTGNTIIKWLGTSDLTIDGFGAGVAGQFVTLSNNGSAVIYCSAFAISTSIQKLYNAITYGSTPIAFGGHAIYYCDGSNWVLVSHEQGEWITPVYSSALFGPSGYWYVEAGDINTHKYRVSGKTLMAILDVSTSTTGGSSANIQWNVPGGYQLNATTYLPVLTYSPDGGFTWFSGGTILSYATLSVLYLFTNNRAAWPNVTNNLFLSCCITVPIS